MKAYVVSSAVDYDLGNEIVWANNYKEAKKSALSTDIGNETEFIHIRLHHDPAFDDMENSTGIELSLAQWREGWQMSLDAVGIMPDCDTATDEEFLAWYRENF